jgi:hypothetical protein
VVGVSVEGDGGGKWTLRCAGDAWMLSEDAPASAACTLRMDADTAWRVLLHALPPERARPRVSVDGDAALAEPFLHARAVMV